MMLSAVNESPKKYIANELVCLSQRVMGELENISLALSTNLACVAKIVMCEIRMQ